MGFPWLRLYTDITWDRKLRRHPPSYRWVWIGILCLARRSPKPGYLLLSENVPVTFQDVSDETAVTLHETEEAIKIFLKQDMLTEENGILKVTHWDKRQFTSDNSTERVRKYREKKRRRNVSETPPDTDTDTDTDLNSSCCIENDLARVKLFYENNIGVISPITHQAIEDWLKYLSADVMIEAFKRAVKANKRRFDYIEGILRNWHKEGLTTLGAIKAQEQEKNKGGEINGRDQEDPPKSDTAKRFYSKTLDDF